MLSEALKGRRDHLPYQQRGAQKRKAEAASFDLAKINKLKIPRKEEPPIHESLKPGLQAQGWVVQTGNSGSRALSLSLSWQDRILPNKQVPSKPMPVTCLLQNRPWLCRGSLGSFPGPGTIFRTTILLLIHLLNQYLLATPSTHHIRLWDTCQPTRDILQNQGLRKPTERA